ncbi:hypothetical protein LCGC14_2523610 [marine sediment metagenome]|uniref:Uncharacterized protein n=1 Tax=marine sediment metagenome TaxID=412755 RepID=A0A0F9AW33_9ZZZZ
MKGVILLTVEVAQMIRRFVGEWYAMTKKQREEVVDHLVAGIYNDVVEVCHEAREE